MRQAGVKKSNTGSEGKIHIRQRPDNSRDNEKTDDQQTQLYKHKEDSGETSQGGANITDRKCKAGQDARGKDDKLKQEMKKLEQKNELYVLFTKP